MPCRCEVAGLLAEFLSKKLPAPNHYLLGYVFLHAQHVVLNVSPTVSKVNPFFCLVGHEQNELIGFGCAFTGNFEVVQK